MSLSLFPGGAPLVSAAFEVLQQEHRCRDLEGISRDGEDLNGWM